MVSCTRRVMLAPKCLRDRKLWSAFIWLGTGKVVGSYKRVYHKMQGIPCCLDELLSFSRGTELLSNYPPLECCLITRFYAVILSLMFCVNCFNLVRMFVINLVVFYTFFLLLLSWPSNCTVYVYLRIVTFKC